MSICAYPQVRIYEDFDKMSAKEVYYNEAGNKITVKLLHFPDIPPEEINKMRFDDDDDDNVDIVVNGHEEINPVPTEAEEEDDDDDEDDDGGEIEEVEREADVEEDTAGSRSTEALTSTPSSSAAAAAAASRTHLKKALRKKSSTLQLHSRKCSIAFAQAHGIKITPPPQTPPAAKVSAGAGSTVVPSWPISPWSTSNMPTIMFPSNCNSSSLSSSSGAERGVANAMGGSFIGGGVDCGVVGGVSVGGLKRSLLSARRSPSPSNNNNNNSLCPGYAQYSKSLLEVPMPRDYGYASSDDLSSEWDSDVSSTSATRGRTQEKKPSGWRKIRNIVQWTPFFQTYKKQRYPWVQLAGHQGNFKAGPEQGTVLKKLCPKEEDCFQVLMKDVLRPYVPEYKGQVTSEDGESVYLQLQDLLSDFHQPCVMDCKIGVRTYLEEELSKAKEKPKLRKDMYEKMIQIDPDAPNEDEHKAKGVTKPRYMVWRETISSTATLGFRIEGIKKSDGTSSKDFKTTKSREQIMQAFREFINGSQHALPRYIQRLRAIRATLECSDFFRTHEVIGSSLLFVHDRTHASVWLIDFAKTVALPANHQIDHNTTWKVGNHEDGYLIGINNLIELFGELEAELAAGGGGGGGSNELSVSTGSSSTSSSASMSPMRSVSESNIDEAQTTKVESTETTTRSEEAETTAGSEEAKQEKKATEEPKEATEEPKEATAEPKESKDEPKEVDTTEESEPAESRQKEEVEQMEKTQSQRRREVQKEDAKSEMEVEKF